jgi:hypothetical protein
MISVKDNFVDGNIHILSLLTTLAFSPVRNTSGKYIARKLRGMGFSIHLFVPLKAPAERVQSHECQGTLFIEDTLL